MRYINLRFTYLLTYLLTYLQTVNNEAYTYLNRHREKMVITAAYPHHCTGPDETWGVVGVRVP